MHSSRAMDKQLPVFALQHFLCELHPAPEQSRRLFLKIVVCRIPQHLDVVLLGQRRVVKLDLHVDDVRDPRLRHRRHILRVPDPASDRNPICQPGNIHPTPASMWGGHSCPPCPVLHSCPPLPENFPWVFPRVGTVAGCPTLRAFRSVGVLTSPTQIATGLLLSTAPPHSTQQIVIPTGRANRSSSRPEWRDLAFLYSVPTQRVPHPCLRALCEDRVGNLTSATLPQQSAFSTAFSPAFSAPLSPSPLFSGGLFTSPASSSSSSSGGFGGASNRARKLLTMESSSSV